MECPYYGSRRVMFHLRREGYAVGRTKARSLMAGVGWRTVHPGPRTTKPRPGHKIYPYLLRHPQARLSSACREGVDGRPDMPDDTASTRAKNQSETILASPSTCLNKPDHLISLEKRLFSSPLIPLHLSPASRHTAKRRKAGQVRYSCLAACPGIRYQRMKATMNNAGTSPTRFALSVSSIMA